MSSNKIIFIFFNFSKNIYSCAAWRGPLRANRNDVIMTSRSRVPTWCRAEFDIEFQTEQHIQKANMTSEKAVCNPFQTRLLGVFGFMTLQQTF